MNYNYQDVIKNRRSIRKFEDRSLPQEYLEQILEAARLAPSGTNRQPWRFVLLTEKKERERLTGAVVQPFVLEAPALFVCCLDRNSFTRGLVEERLKELVAADVVSEEAASYIYQRKMPERVDEVIIPATGYLDLGIAIEHMALLAASLGLGSCWVRLFDPIQVHKALGLPAEIEVIVLLPVGYPAQSPPPRPRLTMDEIIIKPSL
ncbi:MAG TPA: nitroreductase family protein [Candidatus Limnocylindrales bacterium]|nr:nitroreductase family protein [Candidatus Limnocylindrales bacterium]